MPVDTATRAFLDMLAAAGGPPLHELPVAEVRGLVRNLSQQLGGTPTEVHHVTDRRIPVAGGDIALRVYTPRATAAGESLPIVLHYHGGGWVAGDLDSHDAGARYYCRHADAIVVSVDYRLAPEHRFPTAVEDSFAALRWAVDHATDLGGDPARVAVAGDSAGGNLSAVMCLLAKSRGGPRIVFQALVYPGVDLDLSAAYESRRLFGGGDYFLSTRDMEWFQSLYLESPAQATDPLASPIRAGDLTGLPAALVVTAGCDPLRDEGKAYADRLAAAGVPVEYVCFDGSIHAFMSFPAAMPVGIEGLALVADRLRNALSG